MSDCVYTFYVMDDELPCYPRIVDGEIKFTWKINRATTWKSLEDFSCLMDEYVGAVAIAIYNKRK